MNRRGKKRKPREETGGNETIGYVAVWESRWVRGGRGWVEFCPVRETRKDLQEIVRACVRVCVVEMKGSSGQYENN